MVGLIRCVVIMPGQDRNNLDGPRFSAEGYVCNVCATLNTCRPVTAHRSGVRQRFSIKNTCVDLGGT